MVVIRHMKVNGVDVNLPGGFRFMPSEPELVLQYLCKKMLSIPLPLPNCIYPEVDMRLFDPWELPGQDNDDEKYYFTTIGAMRPARGRNLVRPTISGVWKMRGAEVAIMSEENRQVAAKRVYNYQTLNNNNVQPVMPGTRVSWTMHEYRLVFTEASMAHLHNLADTNEVEMEITEYYMCKIIRTIRRVRGQIVEDNSQSSNIDMEEGQDSS